MESRGRSCEPRTGGVAVAEPEYNPAAGVRTEASVAKYCDWLDDGRGGWVLDVGCGDGTPVHVLTQRGHRAVGIDLRPWPWSTELHFVVGDGYRIPFRDGSFDAVGSFATLEHLEHPEEFLAEMARVVRPGGRVVVGAPNMYGSILLHPGDSVTHSGGFPRYAKNFALHVKKQWESITAPERVEFDVMEPDLTKRPAGASDYDAICATDPSVVRAVLRRHGIRTIHQSPSLEYAASPVAESVSKALEVLPGLRDLFGGIFIVGEKLETEQPRNRPDPPAA